MFIIVLLILVVLLFLAGYEETRSGAIFYCTMAAILFFSYCISRVLGEEFYAFPWEFLKELGIMLLTMCGSVWLGYQVRTVHEHKKSVFH